MYRTRSRTLTHTHRFCSLLSIPEHVVHRLMLFALLYHCSSLYRTHRLGCIQYAHIGVIWYTYDWARTRRLQYTHTGCWIYGEFNVLWKEFQKRLCQIAPQMYIIANEKKNIYAEKCIEWADTHTFRSKISTRMNKSPILWIRIQKIHSILIRTLCSMPRNFSVVSIRYFFAGANFSDQWQLWDMLTWADVRTPAVKILQLALSQSNTCRTKSDKSEPH